MFLSKVFSENVLIHCIYWCRFTEMPTNNFVESRCVWSNICTQPETTIAFYEMMLCSKKKEMQLNTSPILSVIVFLNAACNRCFFAIASGISMHCSSHNSILLGIHMTPFSWKVFFLDIVQSHNQSLCILMVHQIFAAPAATSHLPEDYLEKVKQVHQFGGYGSKGYTSDICVAS